MPIATSKLSSGTTTGAGPQTVFVCPGGRTTIVKRVDLTDVINVDGAPPFFGVISPDSGASTVLLHWTDSATVLGVSVNAWEGLLVLEPNDELSFNTTEACTYHISGTLLEGVVS